MGEQRLDPLPQQNGHTVAGAHSAGLKEVGQAVRVSLEVVEAVMRDRLPYLDKA